MSDMKCVLCENKAYFSLNTKSLFNYNTDAFVIDGVYCFGCYCEELMRIHSGLRSTMTPDYKALSRNRERELESSNGTVQVMKEKEQECECNGYDDFTCALHRDEDPLYQEPDLVKETDLILKENEEKMNEIVGQVLTKALPEATETTMVRDILPEPEEEVEITKMSPAAMRQKTFEDQIAHAILVMGIDDSYAIAKYLHRPRGSVYNAIKRLGLRDKLKHAGRSRRKSYNSLPENQK